MEPDYIHVPVKDAIRSIYVKRLEDGKYDLEIDGNVVRLIKRGNEVEIDVDEYYVQDGADFWWFDGERLSKIDVAIVEANYSVMFMIPPLLMAYAEVWPFVNVVAITQDGVKKLSFGNDLSEFGIRYRAGDKTGVISPVIERGAYEKVCLTCINKFKAGIVIRSDTRDVDVITYFGFLSFGRIGNGIIELPELGRIDLSQYL